MAKEKYLLAIHNSCVSFVNVSFSKVLWLTISLLLKSYMWNVIFCIKDILLIHEYFEFYAKKTSLNEMKTHNLGFDDTVIFLLNDTYTCMFLSKQNHRQQKRKLYLLVTLFHSLKPLSVPLFIILNIFFCNSSWYMYNLHKNWTMSNICRNDQYWPMLDL